MSISIGYQENSTNQALFRFSPRELKFILYLSRKWFSKYDVVTASQATFAEHEGVSTRTINEWLRHLYAFGYVEKKRNALNKFDTCEYRPTALLKRSLPHIRQLYVMFKYAALTISISTCAPEPDFVPYKDIRGEETRDCSLVHSLSNSLSLSCYPSARATQTETRTTRNKFPKRGTMEYEWLSPELRGVTELLNLNKWGQIKLSAFPKQALQHAAVVYRSSKSAKKDPFHWFREVCNEWCIKNNTSPDYGQLYRLEAKYNMPENPTYVLEKKPSLIEIPPKQAAPVKKMYPDWQGKRFFTEEEHEKNRYEAVKKFAAKDEANIFRLILIEGWTKQEK